MKKTYKFGKLNDYLLFLKKESLKGKTWFGGKPLSDSVYNAMVFSQTTAPIYLIDNADGYTYCDTHYYHIVYNCICSKLNN